MVLRRIVALCALAGPLTIAAAGATTSEIADAAMRKNKEALKSLISKKTDVNSPQADGATALHWAVYNNDAESVDLLLKAGANVKAANREGSTPLALASINGNAAIADKLVKAGASPNDALPNGETPLMLAARTGNLDTIKVLVAAKADVNAAEKLRGTTALMWAAEQQHPAAVKLLIASGANVKAASASVVQRGSRANVAPTVTQRAAQVGTEALAFGSSVGAPPAPAGAKPAAPGANPAGANQRQRAARAAAAAPGSEAELAALSAGFQQGTRVGGMTALHYAARQGDMETVKALVEGGADVNQQSVDGWTALNLATQNRQYKLGQYLLEHGANPKLANRQNWSPLYLATDNRNIEGGEYPVRQADMDHLEYIKLLLAKGADPNTRAGDYTETRTNFTMQWLNEDGATPFLRAAQSGDVELMKVLLKAGADPKIPTKNNTTALMVATGIGWVEGITYEWSPQQSLEAVKLCVESGVPVNAADNDGRTALHGAAHKGRNEVVQYLVDKGADLAVRDNGSRDTVNGELLGHKWYAVDYSEGLVRVGVQSAIPHPETAALLRKLMKEKGLDIPASSGASICVTEVCKAQ